MKINLITLFLLYCNLLQAQSPIIQRTNYFEVGDSVLVYHKIDTSLANITIGSSGPNVLWEFSTMDFNHPSVSIDTLLYINPVGTPFYPSSLSANYSMSNLCLLRKTDPFSTLNNDYNYYFSNNDSIAFIGHWADNGFTDLWEDHCTDFVKELSFPFSYQNSFLDSFIRFYGDASGSDEHYIRGTYAVTADGYGSLITPDDDTLNNILRVHSIAAYSDSSILFGVLNHMEENYRWFSSDIKGFVLSTDMVENNPVIIQTADYQKQTNYNTSILNVTAGNKSLFIYPNPNNGVFGYSNIAKRNIRLVEIFNSLGQKIYSVVNPKHQMENEINISKNGKGIYFLNIYDGIAVYSEKIVVQ